MPQDSHLRKEEILRRAAESRLGVLSSLESAGKGVRRCVDALPLSAQAFRIGSAVAAGMGGMLLLRALVPSRRRPAAPQQPAPAPTQRHLGRYLLTETIVMLAIPLCRRYLLGTGHETPAQVSNAAAAVDKLVSRLLRLGR